MEAFSRNAPEWTKTAIHALNFCCPRCHVSSHEAQKVWLNRYAPVTTEDYRRKYQEFYLCQCQQVWWAWSSDRPQKTKNED
jgi:hypothetical protein